MKIINKLIYSVPNYFRNGDFKLSYHYESEVNKYIDVRNKNRVLKICFDIEAHKNEIVKISTCKNYIKKIIRNLNAAHH